MAKETKKAGTCQQSSHDQPPVLLQRSPGGDQAPVKELGAGHDWNRP